MIISVDKAKDLTNLDGWSDAKIEAKLKAIEQTIRAYTNNNFQVRSYRRVADIVGNLFICESSTSGATIPFDVGDTIQISESHLNEGLYVVTSVDDFSFSIAENVRDEASVLVTKVSYPADVIDCCISLLEWSVKYGGKVGIKSETLSRHSVTYEDSGTLFMGFPVGIINGLKLHKKARF